MRSRVAFFGSQRSVVVLHLIHPESKLHSVIAELSGHTSSGRISPHLSLLC